VSSNPRGTFFSYYKNRSVNTNSPRERKRVKEWETFSEGNSRSKHKAITKAGFVGEVRASAAKYDKGLENGETGEVIFVKPEKNAKDEKLFFGKCALCGGGE